MQTSRSVALLAPVPLAHLVSGRDVAAVEGRVAFGSRAWELFRELDAKRKGVPADAYIYASHSDRALAFEVSWHGHYIGSVESLGGAHPAGMRYRPPTTAQYVRDSSGKWALFWEVEALRELNGQERLRLADLIGLGKRKAYGKAFVPEGPMLIEHPCAR